MSKSELTIDGTLLDGFASPPHAQGVDAQMVLAMLAYSQAVSLKRIADCLESKEKRQKSEASALGCAKDKLSRLEFPDTTGQ